MAFNFRIDISGSLFDLYEANKLLKTKEHILDPAFDKIEADFSKEMKTAYTTQKAGNKWKKNNPKYLASGKKKDGKRASGREPGVRTGKTKRAFITGKGPGAVRKRGKNFIRMGIKLTGPLRYTTFNQSSRIKLNRKIPVRDPLLLITTPKGSLKKKIREKWSTYLADELRSFINSPSLKVNIKKRRKF